MTKATRGTECYRGSDFEEVMNKLLEFGPNKDLAKSKKCPKCVLRLFNAVGLLKHIEKFHPNLQRHGKPPIELQPMEPTMEMYEIERNYSDSVEIELVDDNGVVLPKIHQVEEYYYVEPAEDEDDDEYSNYADMNEVVRIIESVKDHPFFKKVIRLVLSKKALFLPAKHINQTIAEALEICSDEMDSTKTRIDDSIRVCRSEYLQDYYLQNVLQTYIKPEAFELQSGSFSLISLRALCTKYLMNKSFRDKILRERAEMDLEKKVKRLRNGGFIESMMDGEFSTRVRGKEKVEISIDDIQLVANGHLKCTMVYCTFPDLPYPQRVQSNSIEILAIAKRRTLNETDDPMTALFSKVKEEIQDLSTNGIDIEGENIKVAISTFVGDNLGIYELLGYKKNFNNNCFVCRFCDAPGHAKKKGGDSIQKVKHRKLIEKSDVPLSNFVFDGCDHMTRWVVGPPDLMHDIPEGVGQRVGIELFLTKLAKNFELDASDDFKASYQVILDRFNEFTFLEDRPKLKWISQDEGFVLEGKAIQKLEVLLKLDIILFKEFELFPQMELDKESRVLLNALVQLYANMKEFTLLAFASKFSPEDLTRLNSLSDKIIKDYQFVNPGAEVFCKLHHLSHYGDLIKRFGPLYLYSSWHYEHKHQFSKNIADIMRCFLDPCMTIHKRHQAMRAYIELETNFLEVDLFPEYQEKHLEFLDKLPDDDKFFINLPSTLNPFKLKKNVLRRVKDARKKYWLLTTKFWKNIQDENIYCEGSLYEEELTDDSRPKLRQHHVSKLQYLRVTAEKKYILLDNLHFANDFLFKLDNDNLLIEWIH